MYSFVLVVSTFVFTCASVESTLYELPETKYEWEMLQKGTIRYIDRLKLLRKYEMRVQTQGLPNERYQWPMITEDDKVYTCSVPFLQPQKEEQDISYEDTLLEVPPFLKILKDTCIYRWEGWWTYEFCYGRHIRQFHQEQDGTIPAQFYLGHDRELTSGAPGPDYYSEEYDAGSVCDLTGKERTCEVRFYCDANADTTVVTSIKEPSSCNYVLRIDTPLLCKHPKYVSKLEEETEKILCFEAPIPTDSEVQEEEQKQKKAKQVKQTQPTQDQTQAQSQSQSQTQDQSQSQTQDQTQSQSQSQTQSQSQAQTQSQKQPQSQSQTSQKQTKTPSAPKIQQQSSNQQTTTTTKTYKVETQPSEQLQLDQPLDPIDSATTDGSIRLSQSVFNVKIQKRTTKSSSNPDEEVTEDLEVEKFDLNDLHNVEEVLKRMLAGMSVDPDTLQNLDVKVHEIMEEEVENVNEGESKVEKNKQKEKDEF